MDLRIATRLSATAHRGVTYQGLRLARFVASRRLVKPYTMGHVSGAAVSPLCRSPPPRDAPQSSEFDMLVCALSSDVGGCSCARWCSSRPDCCGTSFRIRSQELRFTPVQGEHHQRSAHLVVWIAAVDFVPQGNMIHRLNHPGYEKKGGGLSFLSVG